MASYLSRQINKVSSSVNDLNTKQIYNRFIKDPIFDALKEELPEPPAFKTEELIDTLQPGLKSLIDNITKIKTDFTISETNGQEILKIENSQEKATAYKEISQLNIKNGELENNKKSIESNNSFGAKLYRTVSSKEDQIKKIDEEIAKNTKRIETLEKRHQTNVKAVGNKSGLLENLTKYKSTLVEQINRLFDSEGRFYFDYKDALRQMTKRDDSKVKKMKTVDEFKKKFDNKIDLMIPKITQILNIQNLLKFVNDTILKDAKKQISNAEREERKQKDIASATDVDGINVSFCEPGETTSECIRNFLGFSESNMKAFKKKAKDDGLPLTILDMFLSTISLTITNDFQQRINRSISNISLNYSLTQEEIRALKSFSNIFIEIIKGFISVDFFKIIFHASKDEIQKYKEKRKQQQQQGGNGNGEGVEMTTLSKPTVTEPTVTEPTVTEPTVTEGTSEKKDDCACNEPGHFSSAFNTIITNINNQIIKKAIKKHLAEYKSATANMKKNMPNLFPDFLKDMVGYMILTLPINIVIFITSLIPIPLPYVMVQSLLNHANKSVNDVLYLFLNAAGESSIIKQEEQENKKKNTTVIRRIK
jgi:hypothetical protein